MSKPKRAGRTIERAPADSFDPWIRTPSVRTAEDGVDLERIVQSPRRWQTPDRWVGSGASALETILSSMHSTILT